MVLSAIVGISLVNAARADCESDLIRLEQALKTPNTSADAKAVLQSAAPKAVAAMRKDDDATCNTVITEALSRAGIRTATPVASSSAGSPVSLGDLSSYRVIAVDTLCSVKTGDLGAAKVRIKDLESTWDAAEAALKPIKKDRWIMIDKAIDAALKQLRAATPVATSSAEALQTLVAKIDADK